MSSRSRTKCRLPTLHSQDHLNRETVRILPPRKAPHKRKIPLAPHSTSRFLKKTTSGNLRTMERRKNKRMGTCHVRTLSIWITPINLICRLNI
jgi:hypothetical protein